MKRPEPTWAGYLEWVSRKIRTQAYPPDAAARLGQGDARYRGLDLDGKGTACLGAKILLRMCLHFHSDLSGMRGMLAEHFQDEAVLYAFDDLLRRMAVALRELDPQARPDDGPWPALRALQLLNLCLYKAEFAQDSASGLFQPTDG